MVFPSVQRQTTCHSEKFRMLNSGRFLFGPPNHIVRVKYSSLYQRSFFDIPAKTLQRSQIIVRVIDVNRCKDSMSICQFLEYR